MAKPKVQITIPHVPAIRLGPVKGVTRPGVTGVAAPFTPYQPPPLPTGTYDPALDAQRAASTRGLQDTTQDTELAGTRAGADYGIGLGQLQTQQAQNDQDYQTAVASLTRNYSNLATSQGEQENQYGVLPGGGAALQAAAKRAANQGIAQTALDTTHTRQADAIQQQIGSLGLGYDRGVTDRTTALTRAGREDRQFGLDVGGEEAFQAGQAGYMAPARGEAGGIPSNEFVDANGNHRRVVTKGGVAYTYDQHGVLISKRKAK